MADSRLFVILAAKISPLSYWTEHSAAITHSLSNDYLQGFVTAF